MIWSPSFLPVLGSFAAGTEVETARGPIKVEMLTPGDWIATADGDGAVLQSVHCRKRLLSKSGLRDKPVLIRAGALGGGLPYRNMIVAPGQRFSLIDTGRTGPKEDGDLLVPAAGLRNLPGVRLMKGRRRLSLFSLGFERRCLVKAEGCAVESGRGWISRWVDQVFRGRAGGLGNFSAKGSTPRAVSIASARTIAPRLRADPDQSVAPLPRRCNNLLVWDRDLAAEQREAEKRSAKQREAELRTVAAASRRVA